MAIIGRNPAASPRVVNVILGVWLFISAFAWPHSQAQMNNTLIIGILAVVFALVSMFVNVQARFVNALLAVWLFISAFVLPRVSTATVWNNVIVAILMFVTAVVPSPRRGLLRRGELA